MTTEEYKKHFQEIIEFLKDQDYISELYKIKALETKQATVELLGDNLVQPLLLCSSTILFMVFASANKDAVKDKSQVQRMRLVAGFLQGIDISTNLLLEGNYIKAAATLKQDYEIMVRINAIEKNKDKEGKTPNPQNGPASLKPVYGYLNDIAHIAKDDILGILLYYENKAGEGGISPVKKINADIAYQLFLFEISIKVEILRQTLLLHLDIFGDNEIYIKALAHYNIITDIYSKEGIISYDEENGS